MYASLALFVLSQWLEVQSRAQAPKCWDNADRKARCIIVQSLGTHSIVAVSNLLKGKHCTSLEVWKRLESTYKKDYIGSEINLSKRLSGMIFHDVEDIQKHPQNIECIFLELILSKDRLPDSKSTACLLKTLFESVLAATLLADANTMEYDQVVSLERFEMNRRKRRKSPTTPEVQETSIM